MDLTLPLDYAAIETDSACTAIRFCSSTGSRSSRSTSGSSASRTCRSTSGICRHAVDGAPVLPPTILTEAVAQVGAIMILAKPENRQRLIFFAGIETRPLPPARSTPATSS